MEKKLIRQLFCFSIFLPILIGCGYTQPARSPADHPHGKVIEVFPSSYFVDVLDSTEIIDEYIVIDHVSVGEDEAMRIAWNRDADAYLNVYYKPGLEDYAPRRFEEKGPYGFHPVADIFCGTLIKYLKYIIPCDSPIVSFIFKDRLWISATATKYMGPVVFRFEDEKKDRFELDTKDLDPGIYEIHVRVGDYPLWTHRGTRWDTSRWIEIVK